MDSTPSPPTLNTGLVNTILGALAQLNSPMDGLDPSVPEMVADLDLEPTLVIDEEAEEMFDGVDMPADGLAECEQSPTNDPTEGIMVDSPAKREDLAWDLLRPYAAALWRVNRRQPGLVEALEATVRHRHLQVPAFPSEPDDRVSSRSSSSSSSSSSYSRSHSCSSASGTERFPGTAEKTDAAVDPEVKQIPPPTLLTSAVTETATDHPQGVHSAMETDGEVLGKDKETANQASPPPAEPANRTPPRESTGSNNAEADARPRSEQPKLCYDCRQPGHIRRDCPNPTGDRICYGCGRHGATMRTCPDCSTEWIGRGPYVASLGRNIPRTRIRQALRRDRRTDPFAGRRDDGRRQKVPTLRPDDYGVFQAPTPCGHGYAECVQQHPIAPLNQGVEYRPLPPPCEGYYRPVAQPAYSPPPPSCNVPGCSWY